MTPRKPLKLLFNFKLWGKLVPIKLSDCVYAFAVKTKDPKVYSALYSKDGNVILSKNFIIADSCDEFLYIETADKEEYFENRRLYFIDLKHSMIIHSYSVYDPNILVSIFDDITYDGRKVVVFDNGENFTIVNACGNLIERSADEVFESGNKFFYLAGKKYHVITKYTEGSYDYIQALLGETTMFLLGRVRNGEMLYEAMGSKGYAPYDYKFKRLIVEKDGIIVKVCNENGEETGEIAFIQRELGRVTVFNDAVSLHLSGNDRIFVERRREPTPDNEQWYQIDLCYFDGSVIDTYKNVYYGFMNETYGIFERSFAVAEDEDGEVFYIDEDGTKYPVPESFKKNLDSYHTITSNYRTYKDPLEMNMAWAKAHAFFIAQKRTCLRRGKASTNPKLFSNIQF